VGGGVNYLVIGLAGALALSVLGNGVLTRAYLGARDARTEAVGVATTANAAAKNCAEGVEALRSAGEKRAKEAEGERDAAQQRAKLAEGRGRSIIAKAQAVPGNACASAQVQIDDWLSNRRAK
jgi:hypothetical protein